MAHLATALTDLIGIDAPIVQAPIGGATTPTLASAVSNAGGLGMLSITWRSPEETRDVIRQTRALTSKPFGVNLVLEWDPSELLSIALEEEVNVVSFFWGDPSPWIAQCKSGGALVAHSVGSPEEAKHAREAGVDIIVAQGWESGGHVWGEVATMALVPAVVDAVPGTPVIAAGGIADGRGLAAALCLGASGVWMGTRFLLAQETPLHPAYRQRLERETVSSTVHTDIFDDGWPNAPIRTLRNQTYERWLADGRPTPGARWGANDVIARSSDGENVLRYQGDFPTAGVTGDVLEMVQYAGQSVGLVSTSETASDIVRNITSDAIAVLRNRCENTVG